MRYLLFRFKRFCGFGAGFVFFISGILKLMDPVGSSLVMQEYFHFLHISFLDPAAKVTAIMFSLAEALVGAGLVTGVWRKVIAPIALSLQGFFTLLTLILVIFNPEMDCGCFGEAIHLSHAETFTKNIVLLTLLVIYYVPAKHLGQTKAKKYVSFGIVAASTVAFMVYSLMYLPLSDFTDYHVGTDLKAYEADDSQAFDAAFIYEKDGVQERFTLENIPDSTWTFVRAETESASESGQHSATLSFYDKTGAYADSVALHGDVMIISFYRPQISRKDIIRTEKIVKTAESNGIRPIVLTSFPTEEFSGCECYSSDRKTLMTLNRSNGGSTLLNDGFILRKWAKKSLPDTKELAKISQEDVTETIIGNSGSNIAFQGFMLYVFAVMLLL